MSQIDETLTTGRDYEGFKICLLTRAVERRRFNASKQYAVAMTSQLYSKPIENRKQIENINALVEGCIRSSERAATLCKHHGCALIMATEPWKLDKKPCTRYRRTHTKSNVGTESHLHNVGRALCLSESETKVI